MAVVLRGLQLLSGRSLSLDESLLALNLTSRSFGELFDRLDNNQAAPYGFLALQKLAVDTLGDGDVALRLLPFAAGIAAVFVFALLTTRALAAPAAAIAISLLAVADPLIYWSTTDKQYAFDVLAVVVLAALVCGLQTRLDEPRAAAVLGAAGAAAIWFSHAAVLMTAGVAAALAVTALLRGDLRRLLTSVALGVLWLASLTVSYALARDNLEGIQESLEGTPGAFVESPDSGALRDLLANYRYLIGARELVPIDGFDLGLLVAVAALCFCVVGAVSLLRRAPLLALVALGPLPFLLGAAAVGKYPLLARTLVFLLPLVALLLGQGIWAAITSLRRRPLAVGAALVALAVGGLSASAAVEGAAEPRSRGEMKPVLAHLAREQRPADLLYLLYASQYSFRHYLECDCAGAAVEAAERAGLWPVAAATGGPEQWAPALRSRSERIVVGAYRGSDPRSYFADFEALLGSERAWILLSDIPDHQRAALLARLDELGTRLSSYRGGPDESSAAAYLYDLAGG